MATLDGLQVRDLHDDDAEAVIDLIGSVYAEYPGCVLDLPGVDADLPELAARLRGAGGRGWVVVDDGDVVACVGVAPRGQDRAEVKRLYVALSHRRRGLGRQLVEVVEEHASRTWAVRQVELWSDSRFADAHRLYTRCGYEPTGATRQLHDPSDTTELEFVHRLAA